MKTDQTDVWSGSFGRDYTDRNTFETAEEFNQSYIAKFGRGRDDINLGFLADVDRGAAALEVGCNKGNQLAALRRIGFSRLYGIELQLYAAEQACARLAGGVCQAAGFELPFRTGSFDLVFTSNVLIHISPEHIGRVIDEMYRCTERYIWGFEYYAPQHTEISYRGHTQLMWKADFAGLFRQRHPDLRLVREERFQYLSEPDNTDSMYLLEKPGA